MIKSVDALGNQIQSASLPAKGQIGHGLGGSVMGYNPMQIIRTLLLFCSVVLLWLQSVIPVAIAQPIVPIVTTSEIIDIGTPLSNLINENDSRYDAGSVSGFAPKPIAHVFVLRNDTTQPVIVSELRSACGCTSAILEDRNVRLPFRLPPGQQMPVQVIVDAANLSPGTFTKAVWVYAQGQAAPAAALEIMGTLLPVARLSTPRLDFGRLPFGSPLTLPLTITLDRNAWPKGSRPYLTCSNPDIQIVPVQAGAQLPSSSPAPSSDAQTYRITLSPKAHLGQLGGRVDILLADPEAEDITLGSVPIQGEVFGDVSSSPSVVAFGTVQAGHEATQQIMLRLAKDQHVTVSSESASVSARVVPLTAHLSDQPFASSSSVISPSSTPVDLATRRQTSQVLLDVKISANAPPEPLETYLTVTIESGQQLRMPLFAMIVPARAKP